MTVPLLSGEYRVDWVSRAGRVIPVTGGDITGRYNRVSDDTSEASLTITVGNSGCPTLPTPRADEMRITRTGDGLSWVGPVLAVVDDQNEGSVTITAADRSYWWQGAPLSDDIVYPSDTVDPVTVFRELVDQAERYQPSGLNIPAGVGPLFGQPVGTAWLAGSPVWARMQALSTALIDFTVVGDRLWWGGGEIRVADGPTLAQSSHWTSSAVSVTRDGTDIPSQVVVFGPGGIIGAWPATDADTGFGRRTRFVDDTNISTITEATAVARVVWESSRSLTDVLGTGSGSLSATAPVGIHDLIPGRKFPVVADAGCLRSTGVQRLLTTTVEFSSGVGRDGWALLERSVAVGFGPVGIQATQAGIFP